MVCPYDAEQETADAPAKKTFTVLARVILAAAALGGSLLIGRKAINQQIEERLPTEIEAARNAALAELDKQVGQVVTEHLTAFAVNLLIKTGFVGAAYYLFSAGHLSGEGLSIVIAAMIAGFLLRDAAKTLPYVAPAFRMVKIHRWNPKRALTEFVAGIAFERTYAEAMIAAETGPNRLWLALSKYNAHNLSTEVATAVADLARSVSFNRILPRVLIAVALGLVMSAFYAAFLFFALHAA